MGNSDPPHDFFEANFNCLESGVAVAIRFASRFCHLADSFLSFRSSLSLSLSVLAEFVRSVGAGVSRKDM